MLRYDRQTKPGLVALYDIRLGNGAGPFLQPRSPHGASATGNIDSHKSDLNYNVGTGEGKKQSVGLRRERNGKSWPTSRRSINGAGQSTSKVTHDYLENLH